MSNTESTTKKFYWLKLKEGFFGEKEIKKLRRIAGGDTYTIIYLKLMLLSLRDNGRLYYEGIEDSFYEELALEIDEEPDNVKVTLLYLQKMGLMEEISSTESFLTRIPECVGKETEKAALMRKSRARKKALESGNNVTEALPPVTESYPEIDKEREVELEIEGESKSVPDSPNPPAPKPKKPTKHKYGEFKNVLLTDEEVEKLCKEYGVPLYKECITFLDEYIEMKGYKAKSHYMAIRKWVIDAVKERAQRNNRSGGYGNRNGGNVFTLSNGQTTNNPFLADLDKSNGDDLPFDF